MAHVIRSIVYLMHLVSERNRKTSKRNRLKYTEALARGMHESFLKSFSKS